jgi:dTDP-4-amino-4,6-dideoxygalactose transaminase
MFKFSKKKETPKAEKKSIQLFRPKYDVESCLENIEEVLRSGWCGYGPKSKSLEKKWCEFTGSQNAHYVNSATAALHLAIKSLNLKPGSKVLTTPITFVSTNAVILYENLVPVFCDVDPMDLSLSRFDALRKVKDCDAVIWVHYGGNVSHNFYHFMENHGKKDLKVIEDCAHAAGSFYENGSRVGSLEDTISCFSFQAVKNMPTADSGMICTSDKDLDSRLRKLSWLGIDKDTYSRTAQDPGDLYKWKYDVPELGYKYNGNDIMASIGLAQLNQLDRDNSYRLQIYMWYLEELSSVYDVVVPHKKGSSHHLMVIQSNKRDTLIKALKDNGIAPGVHYLPNQEFGPFRQFYKSGDCPNAEKASERILSLPNHLGLTRQDVSFICEVIKSA